MSKFFQKRKRYKLLIGYYVVRTVLPFEFYMIFLAIYEENLMKYISYDSFLARTAVLIMIPTLLLSIYWSSNTSNNFKFADKITYSNIIYLNKFWRGYRRHPKDRN
jgi:hypothetical protein